MKQLLAGASLALFATLAACAPSPAPTEAAPAAAEAAAPAAPTPVALTVPSGEYVIDPTHANVTFKVKHMGLANYAARFAKFDAALTLDAADITKSKVTATIDPLSVRTDYPGDYKAGHQSSGFASWDEDVAKNANFLNATAFPAITFTSTAIEVTGEKSAKMTGDLTFLGVTKPVTLDVTLGGEMAQHPFTKQPAIGFAATGVFKRSDFGMTWGSENGALSDEVQISIDAEFGGKPA